MVDIVLRSGKGSPLTNAEVDANFENLKAAVEAAALSAEWAFLTGKPNTLASYGIVDGQETLVSGNNIKTVNGESILGSGNIQIDGGVTSFNGRNGDITLDYNDVTSALGYTPYFFVPGDIPLTDSNVSMYALPKPSDPQFTANNMLLLSGTGSGPAWSGSSFTYDPAANSLQVAGLVASLNTNTLMFGAWNILHAGNYSNYIQSFSPTGTPTTGSFVVQGFSGPMWSGSNLSFNPMTADLTMAGITANQYVGTFSFNSNTVLHAGNYTGYVSSYAPSLTGSGASGIWGISITGSAGSVAWANVTSKPSTLAGYGIGDAAPAVHTHSYLPLTGGTLSGSLNVAGNILLGSNSGGSRIIGFSGDTNTTLVLQAGASFGTGANLELTFDKYAYLDADETRLRSNDAATIFLTAKSTGVNVVTGVLTQQGNQVLHAGNYSSYAAPATHYHDRIYNGASGSSNYLLLSSGNELEFFNSAGAIQTLYLQYSGGASSLCGPGGNVILHAGNYSSYALPLSGGTLTGTVASTGFIGQLFGAASGAPDSWIWSVSPANPTWGIYYNEGTPDAIEFKAGGMTTASIFLDTGAANFGGALTQNNNQVLHAGNYTSYLGDYTNGAYRVIADYTGSNTWYIRSNGRFTWARGHDWTQAFELNLESGTAASNNGWAEFGQRQSNNAAGTWYGTRFVQYTGSAKTDGYARAGRFYLAADNSYITNAGDSSARVQTAYGYIDIGPKNGSWCHIYSDKAFYFNQELFVNGVQVVKNSGTWDISITGNCSNASYAALSGSSFYADAAGNGCKAWALVSGQLSATSNVLIAGLGFSSVTEVSTGQYTATFGAAQVDANYAVVFGNSDSTGGTNHAKLTAANGTSVPTLKTTTQFRFGTNYDMYQCMLAVFR